MLHFVTSVDCTRREGRIVLWQHGHYHYEVERRVKGITVSRSTYLNTSCEQMLEIIENIRHK